MTNPNRVRHAQEQKQAFKQNEDYYNAYTSLPAILFGLILMLGFGSHLIFVGFSIHALVFVLLSLFIMLCFYRVETYFDGSSYFLRYGIGLFERCLSINEIEQLDIVTNHYFSTWLFVPSSKYVVRVFIRGGGKFLIPTHEAKKCTDLLNSKGVQH